MDGKVDVVELLAGQTEAGRVAASEVGEDFEVKLGREGEDWGFWEWLAGL